MQLIKRRGTLVVVSAPSGAGKTTLCHEVRSLVPELYYSVSYTTRDPRPGEKEGTDFFFVSEGQFTAMRARDEFAEWAQVHGHHYGTPAKALEGALSRGLDVLLDIDTHGARQLRQRYPEAVSVFIMAPSMAELEARLRERKSDSGRALPHEPTDPQIPRHGGTRLMSFPSLEKSLDNVSNRYMLVVLAAKRARQLNRGAKSQVESRHKKPTSNALEEIAQSRVGYRVKEEDAPKV